MKFRVARHTGDFEPIIKFYTEFLGLEILGDFKGHNNYDGIFIGKKGGDWHLEFTKSREPADHHFDEDDLLVFYPANKEAFDQIIIRFTENNVEPIKPKNPYWQQNGVVYADPDGHGVVIVIPYEKSLIEQVGEFL